MGLDSDFTGISLNILTDINESKMGIPREILQIFLESISQWYISSTKVYEQVLRDIHSAVLEAPNTAFTRSANTAPQEKAEDVLCFNSISDSM